MKMIILRPRRLTRITILSTLTVWCADCTSSSAPTSCTHNCVNKDCGSDGCGGDCGICPKAAPICVLGGKCESAAASACPASVPSKIVGSCLDTSIELCSDFWGGGYEVPNVAKNLCVDEFKGTWSSAPCDHAGLGGACVGCGKGNFCFSDWSKSWQKSKCTNAENTMTCWFAPK